MLQPLLDKTNDPEFYQNCDLKLESCFIDAKNSMAEIILSINQISYDEPVEYEEWKIVCPGLIDLRGLYNSGLMPYVKLTIFDKHPLLFDFHEAEIQAEVIGKPANIESYISALAEIYEAATGNWKALHEDFWNLREHYSEYNKRSISVPETLFEKLAKLFQKYDLEISKLKSYRGEDKGYLDKPNAKVLIFGNSDISPYEFNLGQPYVIAESFEAERIK